MDFKQLFQVQEIMEQHMRQLSGIDEDVLGKGNIFDLRFLALQVKVGELANITKCYKYSKVREDIPRERLLIRFVDAMRLLLSIGNVHQFNLINQGVIQSLENDNIIKLFSSIFDDITQLKSALRDNDYIASLSTYIKLFTLFITLGKCLGFSFEDVYQYYMDSCQKMGVFE